MCGEHAHGVQDDEVEAVIREHTKEDEALYERALAKFKEDYEKEVGRPLPSPQRPS